MSCGFGESPFELGLHTKSSLKLRTVYFSFDSQSSCHVHATYVHFKRIYRFGRVQTAQHTVKRSYKKLERQKSGADQSEKYVNIYSFSKKIYPLISLLLE